MLAGGNFAYILLLEVLQRAIGFVMEHLDACKFKTEGATTHCLPTRPLAREASTPSMALFFQSRGPGLLYHLSSALVYIINMFS